MKFGIVLCSRCRNARGVRLDAKTATCTKCGKRFDLKKARILCKFHSEKEVASAMMQYNTRFDSGEEIYSHDRSSAEKKRDNLDIAGLEGSSEVYAEVTKKLISIKGRDEMVITAVKELCRCLVEFTDYDLSEVLKRVGLENDEITQSYIAKLKENNVIYEPKSGVYRCLDLS